MQSTASWRSRQPSHRVADERVRRSQHLLVEELSRRGIEAAWFEAAMSHVPARLDEKYLAVIRHLGVSTDSSDAYSSGHGERVAWYASEVAAALGLTDEEIGAVRFGAYLHDVGKVRVPPGILTKAGRLTPEEYEVMKMHPVWGVEVLEGVELPVDVRPTIRWHHERCDGSGYPDGLRGDEIPVHPAIIAVADVYDALTSSRSYRSAMTSTAALAKMRARRSWWRPEVYAAFCRAAVASARAPSPGAVAAPRRVAVSGSPAAA